MNQLYEVEEYSNVNDRWYTIYVVRSYWQAFRIMLRMQKKHGDNYRIRKRRE